MENKQIEEIIETQYISIDHAVLRVFVDDTKIFNPLFNLHKFGYIEDQFGDMIEVPDKDKRSQYNVPNFIMEVGLSSDVTYKNCLLFYVDGGYDIMILHNWIQEFSKQQNNGKHKR